MTIILEQISNTPCIEKYKGIRTISEHKIEEVDTACIRLIKYENNYYVVVSTETYQQPNEYSSSNRFVIIRGTEYAMTALYENARLSNKLELVQNSSNYVWEYYDSSSVINLTASLLNHFNEKHKIQ